MLGREPPRAGLARAPLVPLEPLHERLGREVRARTLDGQGQHLQRVVDDLAGELGDRRVGVDRLVRVVRVAGAHRLLLGKEADAECVAPLVGLHELADVVGVGEADPGENPLRRPLLQLRLAGHEERQHWIGREDDRGDAFPAQRTHEVLRGGVGQAVDVERIAAHVGDLHPRRPMRATPALAHDWYSGLSGAISAIFRGLPLRSPPAYSARPALERLDHEVGGRLHDLGAVGDHAERVWGVVAEPILGEVQAVERDDLLAHQRFGVWLRSEKISANAFCCCAALTASAWASAWPPPSASTARSPWPVKNLILILRP